MSLRLVTLVGANILHTIRHRWGDKLQEVHDDMINTSIKFVHKIVVFIKAGYSVISSVAAPSQDYTCLSAYICDCSLCGLRHEALRKIPTDHALCGIHREIWPSCNMCMPREEEILARMEEVPDPAGDIETRQAYTKTFIMPPTDPDFLRINKPILCGKLLLNVQTAYHRQGIAIANGLNHIFPMAHLYNAMRQLGYLDQPWPAIDTIISLHIKPFFLGALPTDILSMLKRSLLASGRCSVSNIAAVNKFASDPNNTISRIGSKRKPDLTLTPMLQILADYFTDENIPRALHRLDEEMVRQAGKAALPRSRSFLDLDPIFFLEGLRRHLFVSQEHLRVDYLDMTMTCNALFEEIDYEMRTGQG